MMLRMCLSKNAPKPRIDRVGEILPSARHAGHDGLAAELTGKGNKPVLVVASFHVDHGKEPGTLKVGRKIKIKGEFKG
jgi:hypothetical protein